MFERFTEQARQAIVLAQDEARQLKHNYIGTEHLLLGLLRLEDWGGRELLDSIGVTVEGARARVRETCGEGAEIVSGQIPFTPRAKEALELSLREALSGGDGYIGPEYLLHGLLRARGVDTGEWDEELFREGVRRLLSTPGDRPEKGTRAYASGITVRPRSAIPGLVLAAPAVVIAVLVLVGVGVFIGWLIWGH